MRKLRVDHFLVLLCTLFLATVPILCVRAPESYTLIWQCDWVPSSGAPVSSPVLQYGRQYRIDAKGWFISCVYPYGWINFAADAQYYTEEFAGTFEYGGYWTTYSPAPGGQSFLQINGMPVDWGPFSNGGPNWGDGHEYTTYYIGEGTPITFAIVDVIDGDGDHNYSHMIVKIYEGPLVAYGETAFAYGGTYATCFLCMDFDGDGKSDFKNWGWSNGPLGPGSYEFDIYAGAAKCDLSKGILVGTLTIGYDGSTATVTYLMNPGWTMGFAQLYLGSEPLPRDSNDEYTTAPGQYPLIKYVDGPTTTFTVPGLSGDIYVVAHADVFEV